MLSFGRSRILPAAAIFVALSMVAAALLAQGQGRLSRECRQEIVRLCGSDRSQVRNCMQEKFAELSSKCSEELRTRMGERRSRDDARGTRQGSRPYQASVPVSQTVIYGEHIRQQVDIYTPSGAVDPQPLVLFIHGGGWAAGSHKAVQAKPAHFHKAGLVFASAGYRILPDAPVEEQAKDIGAAIQAVHGQASAIGIDSEKIILMGHSAGAHLAALVATDPTYAGEAFDSIKGVILLDGAAYDIAGNMAVAGPRAWQVYNTAFGYEPARQAALSPLTHVGGPDAPNWLALYVEEREIAGDQSRLLSDALIEAGSQAIATPVAGTDHMRMNRELGLPGGAAQTEAIDAFIAMVLQ